MLKMNNETKLFRVIGVIIFLIIWITLLFSVFFSPEKSVKVVEKAKIKALELEQSAMKSLRRRIVTQKKLLSLPSPQKVVVKRGNPPPYEEIKRNTSVYLQTLHQAIADKAGPKITGQVIWDTFLDVTTRMPMYWDTLHKNNYHIPRKDGSIFVGVVTYRDPYCPMTMKSLFSQAHDASKLNIVLFQQNCFEKVCRTGVLKGGIVEDTKTDIDCYIDFCQSPEGIRSNACNTGQIRLFNVNETESLGPYMARYLAVKFYQGEQYYLQIDSHSEFVKDWDLKLIQMVKDAPAEKPIISCYPPDSTMDWKDSIGYRICDSEFADAQIEFQIIRLGAGMAFDRTMRKVPAYAPFIAAGFFFGPADLLHEVPFDPLLPYIFMGEEISMSARLWTSGYDIFSPTTNVLNHYYVRRHYPKFWESVNRFFKRPIHNDIAELVIKRCKHLLDYPESRAEYIHPSTLLYRIEDWGMGKKRSYYQYLQMVGLNMNTKEVRPNLWCHRGEWPDEAKPYYVKNDCLELKMTYLQVKEYIMIVENIFWSLGQYHDTCSEEDLVGVFISQMAKINISYKLYDILLQNKLCDLFFKTFAQHAYTFFLIYGPIIKNMNAVIIEAVETDHVTEDTIDT